MSTNRGPWYLLQTGGRPAAENMAVDEILLDLAPQLGKAVLRFYHWTEAAASFGYFQKFAEVQCMTALRPLVRRPTGGGLVSHEADWTYSLIFPPSDPWYALRAAESYRRLHEWIRDAFQKAGLQSELSPGSQNRVAGQCFVGAEQFDLVWQGSKIAGAAQRRTRQGLLIQGSIQPPLHLAKADWQQAFCDVASDQSGVKWTPLELAPEWERRIQELARSKYASPEYNERRHGATRTGLLTR